ncbi:MAG: M20 family metallopeptidase [Thermanaerothrix sp.]|nr:M20 family metallopeptidase [Thermanaerothrix sp.]
MKEDDMCDLGPELLAEAQGVGELMVSWRREFHQFPELAFEENITASRITQALSSMKGMRVFTGLGVPTSVVGLLRGDIDRPALVLRAEMDALPLEEETGLPFSSSMPGVMHACGHDAHMASLLGCAMLLSNRAEQLERPVIFLFQPAEEGRGGAKALVDGGLFRRFKVDTVLGVLMWPHLPYGYLATRKGVMTALSDRIHVEIRGVGGHAATPHATVDPVVAASHVVVGIQSLISREVDPLEGVVISFGQMEAGYAYNVIPENAHLWGTLRAFNTKVRDYLKERLEEMVPLIARAHRARASVEYVKNYPSVHNDPDCVERVMGAAKRFFGADSIRDLEHPLLSGEDFSFYSMEVSSCLMLLGTGMECGLHHPRYDIPEELMPLMAAWEAFLAVTL